MWVNALRSKEYKQTKHSLRTTSDTYCCLGVLCDLYAKDSGNNLWQENSPYTNYTFDDHAGTLPECVVKWAEINNTGTYSFQGIETSLTVKNDQGFTFEQIAKLIEEHF